MKPMRRVIGTLVLVVSLSSGLAAKTQVTKASGGTLPNGAAVEVFTLKDEKLEVQIATYGGEVLSIKVPDRDGKVADVVLGFDTPAGYYENSNSKSAAFFGPIVGRYANRVAHAKRLFASI